MVRSTGWAIHHTSKAVHRLLLLGTGLVVIASCLTVGASWRLAQGPIDLGWFADRMRAAIAGDAEHVSFDGVALAWEGFRKGVDHPVDLRISNLVMADPTGGRLLAAPDAHITLSLAGLLVGRFVPRSIEVDHGQVSVTREATGQVNLGWGQDGAGEADTVGFDLEQLRAQIALAAGSDHGPTHGLLEQIRQAHFRDSEVTFRDRGSGLTVAASNLDVELTRAATGRIGGSIRGRLSVGGEQVAVAAEMDVALRGDSSLDVRLGSFRPGAIVGLPPAWRFLTGVDLPVAITAAAAFDAAFQPRQMRIAADFGPGRVRIGQSEVPLRGATIALAGTSEKITITRFHLDLAGSVASRAETIDFGGSIIRASDRLTASLTVRTGQLDVADLPRFWPVEIGGGARPWVTEHVTGGTAMNGKGSVDLEADEALRSVVVTKATGDLDVSNGSFTWLDNMPPVEQALVHLHVADADTLDIRLVSGRQRINRGPDLLIKDGTMRISGLSMRDQITAIHTQIDGPVISALSLLGEPRLHLLSEHPIGVAPTGGDASAALDLQFPLENNLQIDEVQVHATARLARIRVPAVVGGQDLEDGGFDLSVDKDGLGLRGRALLARIPVTLDGTMDFNPGLPDQIVQRIALGGKPDAAQLDAAGLHVSGVMSGPIPISAVLVERRGGDGSVSMSSDLTQSGLAIGPLGWRNPPGVAANASGKLLMSHDRPVKIDNIGVSGDGLAVSGSANFSDDRLRSVQLDTIRLGRTQGHGTLNVAANGEIDIALQGGQIDLALKLTEKKEALPQAVPVTTPAWKLGARFDQAFLANGESASDILVSATGGGDSIRLLDAIGTVGSGGAFSVKIDPLGAQRHLSVEAKDAGRFLRGLDAIRNMESGHLMIDGGLPTPFGLYPVSGAAVIDNMVVRNSPILGKLLQAITLYGLVDALRGPGMRFSRIVAPYQYDGADLVLNDAHAANPSLGLTAQGRIGLSSGQISISGTIVPAYFFNSMLGNLPLVGKLFSPEKGGGVFAARFALDGSIADPGISINPVSALTPGFLRDIFGMFDTGGGAATGTAPKSP